MAVPFSTWLFGGASALLLLRGLWNPHRAVLRSGGIQACPGPEGGRCEDTLALSSEPGTAVYAVGSGTVMSVGDGWVHIQVSNEPVVLHYFGLKPDVEVGQHVGRGRPIGESIGGELLEFGVTRVVADPQGGAMLAPVEPSSWLASRGYTPVVGQLEGGEGLWCGQKRHIEVPAEVHAGCGLTSPDKSSFALLPVSVTQE